MLLAVLALVGCQSAAPAPAPAAAQTTPSYPGPAAAVVAEAPADPAYPAPAASDELPWEQVRPTLMNQKIAKFVRGEGLNLQLTLKDGTTLKTVMPDPEALAKLLKSCGPPCAAIPIE
jgi:hypothetical protein